MGKLLILIKNCLSPVCVLVSIFSEIQPRGPGYKIPNPDANSRIPPTLFFNEILDIIGVRFKKIKEDEIDKIDDLKLPNVPSTSAINEPVLPYKSLKAPRLNELKRAIEQKNNTKFDELLAENPYFIINMSGDTPTIIQSGTLFSFVFEIASHFRLLV